MSIKVINVGREIHNAVPGQLKCHPKNPRKGNTEGITESATESGFYGALIVQKSTNYVLVGNHRLGVLEKAGGEIPYILVDVDDERAEKIVLADNKASDDAGYHNDILVKVLEEQQAKGQLKGTLYTESHLSDLVRSLASKKDSTRDGLLNPTESTAHAFSVPVLNFGKWRLQLTAEDAADLEKRLREYTDKYGSTQGFVSRMLRHEI